MSLKRKMRMAKVKARAKKAPSPKPTKKLLPPDSVKTEAAEQLFVKVAEDLLHENRELYDSLTPTEQETVLQWLLEALVEEEPLNAVHDVMWEIDYNRKPVPIEQFVRDEYYMGKVFTDEHDHFSMFDPWMDDLKEVHAPGSQVVEWYMTGSIGIGKTSIAMASMAYKIYCLSCLRNPAAYYSLMPKSLIVFGLFSATKRLVADTGYFKLRGYLDASPYFREKFPRSAKIDSKCDFAPTTGKNVQVISGSQGFHALGQDVFSFAIDEVNFMREKKDKEQAKMVGQAYEIFNSVSTRLRSRFMREGGTVPGIMLLMSSRNSQTSFLEDKMKIAKNDPTVFISDYALWDVHPPHRYCGKRFLVEVGDRVSQSRLLKPDEEVREGAKTVSVPVEYKRQFEEDTDQSLRDIAGIATFNISPFIRDRQSIHDAVRPNLKHPFKRQEVTLDYTDDILLSDYFNVGVLCKRVESRWIPRINPSAPRFLHIDLALSGDCGGFAMGHVSGMLKQSKFDAVTGLTEEKVDPFVIMDLMLRIVPPKGSQIDLSKIRAFILFLKKCGFKVTRVSFDGFQSADSIQILRKRKVDTTLLSVDKTDKPYSSLRSAHFDRRIGTYHYDPYIDEVLDLEQDLNAGKTRKLCKIDHPAKASKGGKGSKDVSDAVAGVIWHCIEDERAHKGVPVFDADAVRKKTKVIDPNPETMAAKEKDDQKRRVGGNDYDWEKLRENVNAG